MITNLNIKKRYIFFLVLAVIVATYFAGPKISKPVYETKLPNIPDNLLSLEHYIKESEEWLPLRKDNQARIIWQNKEPEVTEYSVVYLHGFAGSYRDGYPVNFQVAEALGANLYLARLPGHGLVPSEALEDFSPEAAWKTAREALMIGSKIGKKVILLSTSTGGTLALKLAATYPEKVYVLINLSPNIEDDVDLAFLLESPWGYELAQLITWGNKRNIEHEKKIAAQYWDTVIPPEALVDLQILLESTMTRETFEGIRTPVLTLYYYENFLEEDDHVEVEIYPGVHELLSTPGRYKKLVRLTTPKTHYLGSEIKADDTENVYQEIINFLNEDLQIPLKDKNEKAPVN